VYLVQLLFYQFTVQILGTGPSIHFYKPTSTQKYLILEHITVYGCLIHSLLQSTTEGKARIRGL